jgi:hypothetical protein
LALLAPLSFTPLAPGFNGFQDCFICSITGVESFSHHVNKVIRGENVTSDKQIEANRQNARKSTGPRTQEGKAAVRHNAVKHGLLAEEVLILGEDEAAFKYLDERLRNELQPVGELENMLVDRIVVARWRLRRLGRVEADIFTNFSRVADNLGGAFMEDSHRANAFSKLSRYETPIERSLYKALHELQRLQAERRAEGSVPPPAALDIDVSGFSGEGL